MRRLGIAHGRFLPPLAWDRGAPVAVLGSNAARRSCSPARDPVGQVVRVGDWRMRVIGVLEPRGQQLGLDMDDVVVVPVATAMKMLNRSGLFRLRDPGAQLRRPRAREAGRRCGCSPSATARRTSR